MDLWHSMAGMLEVELITADPETRLRQINEQGIALHQVVFLSRMKFRFCISRSDWPLLRSLCESRGDELSVTKHLGLYRMVNAAKQRGVLLFGVFLLVMATLMLPSRILFIKVEGNSWVPSGRIIEAAEACGLMFGTSRKEIRSEQIKNGLLEGIPELKWAGVNTYGCVAVISVREAPRELRQGQAAGIGNVVALRDGLVLECTATQGTLLCKPGELVRKGQILISGYTDCGRVLRVTGARGEIYAQTIRDLQVITSTETLQRGAVGEQMMDISLLVGKKRINLWKDSGIWDATCGRMYQEYVLTLPGGFRLPITLCVETQTRYEMAANEGTGEEMSDQMEAYARAYLLRQMNAGQIGTSRVQITQGEGVLALEGTYVCTEMIGRVQPEQIGE